MEYTTTKYGQSVNHLKLTTDEYYKVLDPFLLTLGIRSRIMSSCCEDGVWMVEIQAENPYYIWAELEKTRSNGAKRVCLNAERDIKENLSVYKR